jgi:hypothetical protein
MNIDLYRTPYPHAIRAIYLESVLPLTPQILYKPLHPLQTTTDLLFSLTDRRVPLLPATKLSYLL